MDSLVSCFGEREDIAVILGLIGMQLMYGSFSVFMGGVLSMGLSPQFIVIFGNLVTAIVFTPVAFFLEKRKRPPKLTTGLLIQFFVLAAGGVTASQSLLFVGLKKASPAISSAMSNLAPSLVFMVAWPLGLEVVDLKSGRSWAKILGTLVCLVGAMALTFLRGPTIFHLLTFEARNNDDMLIGCIYLFLAVFMLACTVILQAATLKRYPAPLSLCAITYGLGSVFTVLLHWVEERGFDMGWSKFSPASLVGIALLGGCVSGVSFSFQGWSIKKKGPVLVAAFNPISTIWSAIFSSLFLGDSLHLGSVVGMVLVFIGLYLVLWGKRQDRYDLPLDAHGEADLLDDHEQTRRLLH